MDVLVTGGGGFLGTAIVQMLVDRGDRPRSFSRTKHPALEKLGIEQRLGDLGDVNAVVAAAKACDVIFHVAAKAGVWGPPAEYYSANVVGTQNVLAACRQNKIEKLVYTSSPSVVFNGRDMENADESAPYPAHYEAEYPKSKARAERMVLEANDESLATVALRPHLIWGPGDNHLVPRLIDRARRGRLRRVGRGQNKIDAVYIDNAAAAHLLAADRLRPGSPISGKAYFIANGEPMPLWDLVDRILATADLPPVGRSISPAAARGGGLILETIYKLFRLSGEPMMTRFVAGELSTAHWFDLTAARRDLGYNPTVSTEEGLRRLRAWLKK